MRVRLTIIILAAALFASSNKIASGQNQHRAELRTQAPQPGPARTFALPRSKEAKLSNGLTIVMIEDHRAPMVTIEAGIPVRVAPSPSPHIRREQSALAEATAQLITEGAGNRTSEALAREIETLGGRISSEAGDDYMQVEGAVVAENAERMIEILGDVLLRPAFHASELALYKNNRIDKLSLDRQEPSFLLREHFNRIVYGSHPYGITAPTPATVRALTKAKIERFHKSRYTPDGAIIVIAGDFDPARIEAKARAIFGGWKKPANAAPNRPSAIKPNLAARRVYLIDRPGSEQADFRIGGLALNRADPDYIPLVVANAILGSDRTGSRLFLNIREQKGYAYDVFSVVSALKQGGTFFAGSQTRNEVTLAAIKEMLAEFDRMRDEKVSAEELRSAKNYLIGNFSLALSTQGGIAGRLAQVYMLGLGRDYLESYRARIEAVTAGEVQRVARKYMAGGRAAIVVVGGAAGLKEGLSGLGPVTVIASPRGPKN